MPHSYGGWNPQEVNADLIRRFVTERRKEDANLQFKGGKAIDPATTPDKQKRQQVLRDILARYACAFANADGGLLVIGVHTGKDPNSGRDLATRWECTSEDLSAQRIRDLVVQVADPPYTSEFLSGLKTDTFDDPSDPTRHGCWVLVPTSHDATHQVSGGQYDGQYLISTQEGVGRIRHDDLVRRLSGRCARLAITRATVARGSHGHGGSGGGWADFVVRLQVRNRGPGPATEPLVEAYVAAPNCAGVAKVSFGPRHPPCREWPGTRDPAGYWVHRSPVAGTLHEGSPTDFAHHISGDSGLNSPLTGQYVAAYQAKALEGLSEVVLVGFEMIWHAKRGGGWSEPETKQQLTVIDEAEIAGRVRFAVWRPGHYPYDGEPWPQAP